MEIDQDKLNKLTKRTEGDYAAFLYDVDGTLADNIDAHKQSYQEVAAGYGVALDTDLIDETAGWPTVVVAKEISRRYGVELPETFAAEKSAVFFEKFIDKTVPVGFVVQHLKNHAGKVRIGIVSGGSRTTVTRTLTVLGIIDQVEVLVCAGDTKLGKPHADPFLLAARQLGVEPARCIVFEDGQPGVDGAIAAGMDWVRVDQI
ncbi:HAD family phosphatase [Pedobacter yulinensis]|uniref:HAD family phosphatase n=1 Tax=Pedobacter yulinensis TaxID=2126353 RepID=A0A2T3HQ59_9SPHI|nr:HAD-IA family hydrolase [Pedobacter yulinensis]PST84582.1 HAD family phosphatase [Pedobacter yulinensis]